jgi:hypothetical protein
VSGVRERERGERKGNCVYDFCWKTEKERDSLEDMVMADDNIKIALN